MGTAIGVILGIAILGYIIWDTQLKTIVSRKYGRNNRPVVRDGEAPTSHPGAGRIVDPRYPSDDHSSAAD